MVDRRKPESKRSKKIKAVLGVSLLTAFIFLLLKPAYFRDPYILYRAHSLLRQSQESTRNTYGRLSGTGWAPFVPSRKAPVELGRVQLMVLQLGNVNGAAYAQGLLDIGSSNWT